MKVVQTALHRKKPSDIFTVQDVCMYECMYVCMYAYAYAHVWACLLSLMIVSSVTCELLLRARAVRPVHLRIGSGIYIYIHTNSCMYVCMHVCTLRVFIHTYMHIHTHTNMHK